jgi:hypothetical protein
MMPDRATFEREQRRSLNRSITARALAEVSHADAAEVVARAWPHDGKAALLAKAAVSPSSTGNYPTFSVVKTLAALAPESAAVRLFERAVKIDLDGVSSVTMPYAATWPLSGFIGEGAPAPVAQFTTASETVGPARKILVMAAVSGELANATADTAQTIVGNVLAVATSRTLDAALFSNAACHVGRSWQSCRRDRRGRH